MQSAPKYKVASLVHFWECIISTFFGTFSGTSPYQIVAEFHALCLFGSVSFIHALPFSCHSERLFVCLLVLSCLRGCLYRCSAMPCVLEFLGAI